MKEPANQIKVIYPPANTASPFPTRLFVGDVEVRLITALEVKTQHESREGGVTTTIKFTVLGTVEHENRPPAAE
jgi:hypothetical protein